MPTVVCPSCGQVAEFEAMRRESGEFCTNCDFPLFWARPDLPLLEGGDADTSRRRLPGAAGRLSMGSKPCGECGEINLIDVRYCIRCGADFDPPPPEPEPEPEPERVVLIVPPPPPPPPPPPDHSFWWILAMVAVALAVILLIA